MQSAPSHAKYIEGVLEDSGKNIGQIYQSQLGTFPIGKMSNSRNFWTIDMDMMMSCFSKKNIFYTISDF